MTGQNVVIAGDKAASDTLERSFRGLGLEVRSQATGSLSEDLRQIEREIERSRPIVAVAVGLGEGAVALAITAAKAGVPVARLSTGSDPAHNSDAARILATLAEFDAGSDPGRAGDLITAWLRGEQPASDLD